MTKYLPCREDPRVCHFRSEQKLLNQTCPIGPSAFLSMLYASGTNFVNGTDRSVVLWLDLANGALWPKTGRGTEVGCVSHWLFPCRVTAGGLNPPCTAGPG